MKNLIVLSLTYIQKHVKRTISAIQHLAKHGRNVTMNSGGICSLKVAHHQMCLDQLFTGLQCEFGVVQLLYVLRGLQNEALWDTTSNWRISFYGKSVRLVNILVY